MATRRPLVVISGVVQELPTSDTLPGGGGGGAAINTVTYNADFGSLGTFLNTSISAAWVTAQTVFSCAVMPGAGHDPEDVLLDQVRAEVANPVAGVGFDINVYAPDSTWGQYTIHIIGVN